MNNLQIIAGTKVELRIEQDDGLVKVLENYTIKTNRILDTDTLQFDRMGLLSETHCPDRNDKDLRGFYGFKLDLKVNGQLRKALLVIRTCDTRVVW